METLTSFAAEILILIFLIIVFLQSSIDKVFDWKGNLSWLKGHFADTPLSDLVPLMFGTILIVEMASSIICAVGLIEIIIYGNTTIAYYGSVLSCIALLMLLFGQRLAKDYEGAKTITVYFMPAVFLVYLLQT